MSKESKQNKSGISLEKNSNIKTMDKKSDTPKNAKNGDNGLKNGVNSAKNNKKSETEANLKDTQTSNLYSDKTEKIGEFKLDKDNKKSKLKSPEKDEKESIQDFALKKGKISLEDQLIRNFDDIIECDEEIIKGYKPNKAKVYLSRISVFILFGLFVLLSVIGVWIDVDISKWERVIGTCLIVGLYVLLFAIVLWFTSLYYNNTFYVYTNKRLIIRTGVFGVDFHSLDIKNIGASGVSVSILDKILRKGTGSIKFGSNSSPINLTTTSFSFTHIEKPYQAYKEIKEYIEKSSK